MNDDGPDWYLAEWLGSLGVTQTELSDATGFGKSKVSELVNGKWHYRRAIVNAVAAALNVEPFELLMHPDRAMSYRRQREDAVRLVADTRTGFRAEPPDRLKR